MEEIPAYIANHKVYCLECYDKTVITNPVHRYTSMPIDPILHCNEWAFTPICCCCAKEIRVQLIDAPSNTMHEGAHVTDKQGKQATIVTWAMRTSSSKEYDWYLVEPIRCEYVELWARKDFVFS